MRDFTPPLHRLSIGTLRSIVLFDAEESRRLTPQHVYLSEAPEVEAVFGDQPYLLIGKINTGSAVLYDPAEKISGVYVDSAYQKDALTRIADSLEHFYQIVRLIQAAWEGKEGLLSLRKNPQNLALRDRTIAEIRRTNPASDAGFWNYLAFRELDIRLRE